MDQCLQPITLLELQQYLRYIINKAVSSSRMNITIGFTIYNNTKSRNIDITFENNKWTIKDQLIIYDNEGNIEIKTYKQPFFHREQVDVYLANFLTIGYNPIRDVVDNDTMQHILGNREECQLSIWKAINNQYRMYYEPMLSELGLPTKNDLRHRLIYSELRDYSNENIINDPRKLKIVAQLYLLGLTKRAERVPQVNITVSVDLTQLNILVQIITKSLDLLRVTRL